MYKLVNIFSDILKYKKILKLLIFIFIIFIILRVMPNSKMNNNLESPSYFKMGVFDENGHIIDNASSIMVKNNNIIKNTLIISHENIPKKDYMLIVLTDFVQQSFEINGKEYTNYVFDVEEDSELKLEVKINLKFDATELDYIIVKRPNYIDKNLELENLLSLSDIFSCRYILNYNSKIDHNTNIDYDKKTIPLENEVPTDIFISKEKNLLNYYSTEKELEKTYITIGNLFNQPVTYAIIILTDWKQYPFEDNSLVKYIKVNPNEKVVYEYTIPDVLEDTNFQVIAFPKPFDINENSSIYKFPLGSTRLIIENIN